MTVRSATEPPTDAHVVSAAPVRLHTCPGDTCQTSDLHIITPGLQAHLLFIINDLTVYYTHPASYCKPIIPCTHWYGHGVLSVGDEGLVLAGNSNVDLLVPGSLIVSLQSGCLMSLGLKTQLNLQASRTERCDGESRAARETPWRWK